MNNIITNNFKRVQKTTAKKLFNKGVTIYLLPCKARLDSVWFSPYPFNIKHCENMDFQTIVNNFEYYNCNNEVGKYTAFYIENN